MIYYVIFGFLLCLFVTPVIREIALFTGWVDTPNENRWHKKPTALMGGIAIYFALMVPMIFYGLYDTMMVWIPMTMMFLLGLVDDLSNIKPWVKLFIQSFVAILIVNMGYRLYWFSYVPWDIALSIVWIVGITNAFNLLDNMDGLATGIGIIASFFLALLFLTTGNDVGLFISLLMISVLSAFLIYNSEPASIFMGDCGSLTIGFVLSILCLFYTTEIKTFSLIPVGILIVPILDTTFVTINRIVHGRKVFIGGKDHLSHKLVWAGLKDREAVLYLYFFGVLVYLFMGVAR